MENIKDSERLVLKGKELVLKGKDIISINDLDKEEMLYIISKAEEIEEKMKANACYGLCRGRILATLFFEPSTRTKLSFEAAMKKLGGKVIGFAGEEFTSRKKGESLYDTIKIIEGYCDIMVMRHQMDGAARLAAEASSKPVINAGDGVNQHPTQTLLDLFTIKKIQGKVENLHIGIAGDLKYGRTVHSLASALLHFNPVLYFIAPDILQMPKYILDKLDRKGIRYHILDKIEEVLSQLDILYMTRIQKERFVDPIEYEKVKNAFILSANMLVGVKKNFKILHPLPRVNEISIDVDTTGYAMYFEQAHNGLAVRMALIALLLGVIE